MITTVLYILLALAFLVIAASLIAWVTHRGHSHLGKHTEKAREALLDMQYARRLRRMNARPVYTPPQTYRVVPDYMQPGSYASVTEVHHGRTGELHKDVVAATLHNPGLLDDIRTERTRNLPGPAAPTPQGSRVGELNLAGQDVRQPETGLLAGEPASNIAMGNWRLRPTYTPHLQRAWADDTGSFTALADGEPEAPGPAGLQYVRDYLTCSIEDLAAAIRADKMGLAVGVRS